MKIIKWIIIIVITLLPITLDLIAIAEIEDYHKFSRMGFVLVFECILGIYLFLQFLYYAVIFNDWFDSKLK